MRFTTLALALALAAASPCADRSNRFGIEMGGGYDTVAMGDVNKPGTTQIEKGWDGALNLNYRPIRWVGVSLGGRYLMPAVRETHLKTMGLNAFYIPVPGYNTMMTTWDYVQRERYNALEGLLQVWGFMPLGPVDLKLGGGGGAAWLSGASISTDLDRKAPGWHDDILLYGSGASWRLAAGADWWLNDNFSVGAECGWRWCRIGSIECAGGASGRLKNADGSDTVLDYSGLSTKLAGTFWF